MSLSRSSFGGRLRVALATLIAALGMTAALAGSAQAAPTANDVFAGANDVTPATVNFNASGIGPITYSIVDGPGGGTLGTIDQVNGSVVYTANADYAGIDTFTYRADDGDGVADALATVTVRPATDVSGPSGLINTATPTFELSSPQTGVTFECKVDAGAFEPCAATFTSPSLGEGTHTIEFRANAGGPVDATPASRTVNVDTIAPVPNIIVNPGQASPTNSDPVLFRLASNEVLDPATVTSDDFDVQNGTIASITPVGNDFDIEVDVEGADPKEFDVTVDPSESYEVADLAGNATDFAGNASRTVHFDSVPPSVVLEGADSQVSPTNDPQIQFLLRADEPLDSGTVDAADFEITNGTFDGFTQQGNNFLINVLADDDPPAEFDVSIAPSGSFTVLDMLGNSTVAAAGADRTVRFDNLAPEAAIIRAAGQQALTHSPDIEFELSANEALDPASVTAADFDVSGGSITGVDGSGSSYTVAVTAAGQGQVILSPSGSFSISDVVGNTRTTATALDNSVLYDLPAVAEIVAGGGITHTNAQPLHFQLSSNEALVPASVTSADFEAVGGSVNSVSGSGDTYDIHVTPAGEGSVVLTASGDFSVEDSAGNLTTQIDGEGASISYDTTPPVASIDQSPTDPSVDPTPTFAFSANEGVSGYDCRLHPTGNTPPAWSSCESPFTSEALDPGDYTFEVRATDLAGNTGAPTGMTWSIDEPQITAEAADELYFARGGEPTQIGVHAVDEAEGELSFFQVGAAHGATVGEFTVNGDVATAEYVAGDGFAGEDTVTIRVENTVTGGYVDVDVTVVVRPATVIVSGPGVDPTPALTNLGQPTFTFAAVSGPTPGTIGGASFSCKLDGASVPAGNCTNGSFTPTSPLSQGDHTLQVTARVGALNVDPRPVSVDFTVDTIAPASPSNLAGPQGLVKENDLTYSFELPEGTSEYRLTSGSDPDPAWTPGSSPVELIDVPDGEHTFQVRTVDAAGNRSGAVSLDVTVDTVVVVNITSAPSDGNLDARPTLEFSSPEDPDVDYSCRLYASDTPSEEIPAFGDCASPVVSQFLDRNTNYTFEVKGVDPAGNEAIARTDWDQSNTAPIAPSPDLTVEAGKDITVPLESIDGDDDPLHYSIISEPTGGSLGEIDPDTGDVTYTANLDAAGTGYGFDFEVTDLREGGTVSSHASITILPDTVFSVSPPALMNDSTPTWEFNSPSGAATFECDFNDNGWEACDSGSYTAAELAEGTYTLKVRATIDGLTDPTPVTSEVTLDVTAPDVQITAQPVELSNVGTPAFDFESSDPTATFECSLDNADWSACESGAPLAALADGTHEFRVRPVDPATNIGTLDSYAWEVDLTEPEIVVSEGPTGGATNARRPIWSFEVSDLNLIGSSVRCKVDSRPWVQPCASSWQADANLADGDHTVTFEADDGATNVRSVSYDFKVVTTAPIVSIEEGPSDPSGPDVQFGFSASTDLGANGGFQYRLSSNGGPYSAWTATGTELELSGLSTGLHTIQVRAFDSAGNTSSGTAVAKYSWNTVGGAPDTVITGNTKSGSKASFAFNSPGNPLATFECKIDQGPWSACTSPKSYEGLAVGAHTFQVMATNDVGTSDTTPASHDFTVAPATAPDTFIDARPAAKTPATDASLEFSSSIASATFECRLDGGAWEACTSPKSYTGLAIGDHTFEVRSADSGLTDASPATVAWQVVDPNPVDPPVCTKQAVAVVKGKPVKLGKGMKVSLQLSHRRAIDGQSVTAKLLVNGKSPNAAQKKKLKGMLKRADVSGTAGIVASLKAKSWKGSFAAGSDTPGKLNVKLVRKQGAALRTTVPFTLVSCAGR